MKPLHTLSKVALILILLSPAVTAAAQGVTPAASKIQRHLESYSVGDKIRVNLESGGHVTGKIVAMDGASLTLSQRQNPDQTVAVSNVKSVRDRSSLASRFKTGPCVDPLTLTIAAPFITVAYLVGH